MRALVRYQRIVCCYSYKWLNIRQCSFSKQATENFENSYFEEWEPKLIGIKKMINPNMDSSDIEAIDAQIDDINNGLKECWECAMETNEATMNDLDQRIHNLHEQLQQKIRANTECNEQMNDLSEQLEQQMNECQTLNEKMSAMQREIDRANMDKNALNDSLNSHKEMIEQLENVNDSIQQNMEKMKIEKNDSAEIAKTKSNMANMLHDMMSLENEYKKLKIICFGLGSVFVVGSIYVYQIQKKLKQTKNELKDIENRLQKMFYFINE